MSLAKGHAGIGHAGSTTGAVVVVGLVVVVGVVSVVVVVNSVVVAVVVVKGADVGRGLQFGQVTSKLKMHRLTLGFWLNLVKGGHCSMVRLKRPVHCTYLEQSDGYGSFTSANKHGRARGHIGIVVGVIAVVVVGVGVVVTVVD